MKYVLIGVVLLVVLGICALFVLGQMSKSGAAPGLVEGRLAPCPSAPNCVSSEDGTETGKRVETLPTEAWAALPEAVAALGGVVTARDEAYLAAEFTSGVFKFVDDVEFRLAADDVHVRSGSRVGYSDGGANAARVAAIREWLEGR